MLYAERLWCEDFRKVVQEVLDGKQVSESIRLGLREHREACPACCDFHDQLLQLTAVSGEMVPPAEYEANDSVGLWKKIIRDVSDKQQD